MSYQDQMGGVIFLRIAAAASAGLGIFLIWIGIGDAFLGNVLLGGTFLLLTWLALHTARKASDSAVQQHMAEIERSERQAREEKERLEKIKASMTPAEWEMYQLQLENQRLLRELKNSKNQTTETRSVGFIREVTEEELP